MVLATSFDLAKLDDLRNATAARVERGEIPGAVMLLDRGGETWCEAVGFSDLAAGTAMREDAIFRIASMTKPFLATAAMMLAAEGTLDLHAPVDPWLPELADRKVLRTPRSDTDDTVPAARPITTHDLLTNQWGLGALFDPDPTPLQVAMGAAGLDPGAFPPNRSPDDWMAAIGGLPLAFQPGEGWLYHTGYDVLCVLLARVTSTPLPDLLRTRIFEPLGMADTGFHTPEASLDRLPTCYDIDPASGEFVVSDPARGGIWAAPQLFPCETVSTAADYLRFARMLRNRGELGEVRLLSRESFAVMTTDYVDQQVKEAYPFFPGFWDRTGWGYGFSLTTGPGDPPMQAAGSYGWSGGFNTHWMNDPENDLTGLFLMQLQMGGPENPVGEFWRRAYDALVS
jgi:CubicO group peptidase (beta-lactamase class C family)